MSREDFVSIAGVIVGVVFGAFLSLVAAVEILSRW